MQAESELRRRVPDARRWHANDLRAADVLERASACHRSCSSVHGTSARRNAIDAVRAYEAVVAMRGAPAGLLSLLERLSDPSPLFAAQEYACRASVPPLRSSRGRRYVGTAHECARHPVNRRRPYGTGRCHAVQLTLWRCSGSGPFLVRSCAAQPAVTFLQIISLCTVGLMG